MVYVSAVKPFQPRTPRVEVRERILRAARSVFADQGFAGATIDAVAEAAGFTKGAVYSNFGSKDDLFFALLDEQVDHRCEMIADLVDAAAEPPTLRALGEILTDGMIDGRDWQLLFVEYWLRAMRNPQVLHRFLEHRRAVRASIEEAVARLDVGSVDPGYAAVLVLALNNGLAIEAFVDPGSVPREMLGGILEAVAGDSMPSQR